MTRKPTMVIVGAGIGGLTVAIALRQVGFTVEVFERATELKEIGAGIALSANAIRALNPLGLLPPIVDRGTVIEAVVSRICGGDTIGRLPTNLTDVPSVCLHRADLQQALFAALPPDCVHFGEQFLNFETTGDGVLAHFASGRMASGDALIGADGLRSRVRTQLIGDGEPVYRGYQCWRGVCHFPTTKLLTETFGLGVRVGLVPIGRRGTAWWCTANEAAFAKDEVNGAKAKLLRWVGNWHPPIANVIGATDTTAIVKTAIYDRRPVKTWSRGCCTLLGDAAHPTTPNMGQGGCMAIEDGIVLARCLSHYSDAARAFRVYERLRYGRTAKITILSRYYGAMGQWTNPGAAWLRSMLLRLGSGKASAKGYVKFVSYDPWKVSVKDWAQPSASSA
jgi:2-polyprenyl-6-methoxyphenol hydroxylase-like FAD-dependent oxidoreductase